MDNLTHSLVAAVMGRMGLKRMSPRAMPAMIIAANLPDIDSFVAGAIGCEPIAEHRGFTHGPLGIVLMALLAVAIMWGWERLRPGKEGPIKLGGLFVAAYLAALSHPLLDLMNTYGTRVLDPFSNRWFYADTLFIMDPWIWIALILGLELSWRAERLGRDWRRPAAWAFTAMLLYIGLNGAISARAVALTRPLVERVAEPRMIVAGEIPLTFWKRKMIWRGDAIGGSGTYNPLDGLNAARLDPRIVPAEHGRSPPRRRCKAQQACPRLPLLVADAAGPHRGRARLSDRSAVLRGGAPIELELPHPPRQ